MRILSNDYESNVPGSAVISQGGTANFSKKLSNFITEKGHEWIGLIVKFKKNTDPRLFLLYEKNQRHFWKLLIPKEQGLLKNAKTFSEIEKYFGPSIDLISALLKKIKPDVIFLNGAYLNPWLILRAGAKLNIPIVAKHPGIWKKELENYSHFFPPESLKSLLEVERDFSRLSSCEIFLNNWSRDVYRKEVFHAKGRQSKIIPLPISPIEKFRKESTNGTVYNIGMVARWDKTKNHKAVLELAKLIKEKKLPWAIHSVTSIPPTRANQKFKEEYRGYIQVESPKNRRDLKEFYRKMDLMILPSRFDVSPHVVPEALFNDTPTLISPNVGWINDYRAAKAKDWIIDFKNPEKVIERIEKIKSKRPPKKLTEIFKTKTNPQNCLKKMLNLLIKIKRTS